MQPRASVGGTPLTPKEIQMRIESCDSIKTAKAGATKMSYAWVSQRGYYPDSLSKPNQDSYTIIPELASNRAFFAVYDGHGRDGHDCAYYCRDHLHVILKETLGDKPLEAVELLNGLRRTHLSIHRQLAASAIDDSLSGTTAVSCLIDGDMMYVSNVGDSRAILVSKEGGKFSVTPLSNDQTPYRKDERERIKKTGARVLSMEQLEGIVPVHENWGDMKLGEEIDEAGDPPRVWSPYGDYPGTAFSRSIGDSIAKELGVVAEPEILARKVSTHDKYVVIASDGVFEFLTNQNVTDIIISQPDIFSACKAVVQQAYELWLRYEVRTDDITIIIIELQYDGAKSPMRTFSVDYTLPPIPTEIRPVRRVMSKEKRRSIIFTATAIESSEKLGEDLKSTELFFEKSEEDKARIKKCIHGNFLFKHLNTFMEQYVVGAMQRRIVTAGEVVIAQGDEGDSFYVVSRGRFEARVRDAEAPDTDHGSVVHVYEKLEDTFPCFGELSLMYGSPRAATVIALEDGELWFLDRKLFRQVIYITADTRKKWNAILRHVPTFSNLRTLQMQSVLDLVKEESYSEQDYVVQDGSHHTDAEDLVYVVSSGTCDITYVAEAAESKLYSLHQYDVFSDHFLRSLGHEHVNVVATTPLELIVLTRADFELIIGSVENVVYGYDKPDEVSANEPVIVVEQKPVHSASELENISTVGMISVDEAQIGTNTGTSLCLGSFQSGDNSNPDVTMHSVVFSRLRGTKREHVEIVRNVDSSTLLAAKEILNASIPCYQGLFKQPNALHFVYRTRICNDLSNVMQRIPDVISSFGTLQYLMACAVSAMEHMHACGIVYRNIQPEGLHVDSDGRLVFIDFRMSKILQTWSNVITGKTFTLCGASEYIAPEQLKAGGYNNSVDYWALGVLVCELASGVNPFSQADLRPSSESSHSETAVFSKIMTLGQEEFPSVPFSDDFNPKIKQLVNDLLVACPFRRLGVRDLPNGIRDHPFFESFDWNDLESMESPLRDFSSAELSSIISDGPKDEISTLWNKAQRTVPDWTANL